MLINTQKLDDKELGIITHDLKLRTSCMTL